nr:type II toxin-antitoxin system RelE/ParE family toxin [Allomuricauda sp.]
MVSLLILTLLWQSTDKMRRRVKVSKTAEKKLSQLLEFLEEKWSAKVKLDFIKKLDRCIELIRTDPHIFPESNKKGGLHKCTISKQTSLYYRFTADTIFIITIFDNRQNPAKLEKEI